MLHGCHTSKLELCREGKLKAGSVRACGRCGRSLKVHHVASAQSKGLVVQFDPLRRPRANEVRVEH